MYSIYVREGSLVGIRETDHVVYAPEHDWHTCPLAMLDKIDIHGCMIVFQQYIV